MVNAPATPLFVLGTARSGTTWLANMLASHPDLAAVTAPEHHGIHESHLFSHTRYVLIGRKTCRQFVERYRREDYFKLLGLGTLGLCDNEELIDIYGFFRLLMEKFAASRGAKYWLEKTPKHTIYYRELLTQFPHAVFVVIQRRFENTLLSNLNMFARPGGGRWRQIAEKVFRYVSDEKAIGKLKKVAPKQVVAVSYEDLLKDKDSELLKVLDFLGLEKLSLKSAFAANSSFDQKKIQKITLGKLDWKFIFLMKFLFGLLPFRLMFLVRRCRDKAESDRFPKFEIIKSEV